MGILGSSGREPCDLRPSEYVTRDAACHSIPLSLDQFRPQWSPSFCSLGRLWQALPWAICAWDSFSGWMKGKSLLPPFSISFYSSHPPLVSIWYFFPLTISPNFSNSFILTKPQATQATMTPIGKEKKIPLVGYFVLPLFKSGSQLSSESQDSVIYTYTLILQRTSRVRINQEPSSTCKNNILIQSDSKPWNSRLINARSLEGCAMVAGTMVKYLPWAHTHARACITRGPGWWSRIENLPLATTGFM